MTEVINVLALPIVAMLGLLIVIERVLYAFVATVRILWGEVKRNE
jgi:hypothetical protein